MCSIAATGFVYKSKGIFITAQAIGFLKLIKWKEATQKLVFIILVYF